MPDAQTTEVRCPGCGAELRADGEPCAACEPVPAQVVVVEPEVEESEARIVAETIEEEEVCKLEEAECAPPSLWMRAAAAFVYAVVCAASVYGSIAFFRRDISSSSDWVFGAMAIGLALIALVGVKQSLFPSDWTAE